MARERPPTRSGARLMRLWIIGPPMQKPMTMNSRMPRWSISPSWSFARHQRAQQVPSLEHVLAKQAVAVVETM
jgi:hypothetical protein